ncbi:G protein-coupled receptor 6 [Elephant endotheliotropic herpesvirus 2]|nr:G protein-coupled receptor 6 [Elephant endotheliotropic herpesvirus 2]
MTTARYDVCKARNKRDFGGDRGGPGHGGDWDWCWAILFFYTLLVLAMFKISLADAGRTSTTRDVRAVSGTAASKIPVSAYDPEEISVHVLSGVGLVATVAAVAAFLILLKRRSLRFSFPYNTVYVQLLFFFGLLFLFSSTITRMKYGPLVFLYINQTPIAICFSCLLIYAFSMFLLYGYDFSLRDWVLLCMAVFCSLISPLNVLYGRNALRYGIFSVGISDVCKHPVILFGHNVTDNRTVEYVKNVTTRGAAKVEDAQFMFTEMSFVYPIYLMAVSFIVSLYSCRKSVYGLWLTATLFASIVLWVVYRCLTETFDSQYLLILNGYLFLLFYVVPNLIFMYKRRLFSAGHGDYVSAVFTNTDTDE